MCQPCWVQTALILWCPSHPVALILLLPLLPQSSLSPKGEDLMEISLLRLSDPKSFTFCILSSCGSLYLFPYSAGENVSDDGQARHKYKSMPECGSHFIAKLIQQNCSICFYFMSLVCIVSGLHPPKPRWVCITSHRMGLNLNKILVVTPTSFMPLLHPCILQAGQHCKLKSYTWVGVCHSPLILCREPSNTMDINLFIKVQRLQVGTSLTSPCSMSCVGISFGKQSLAVSLQHQFIESWEYPGLFEGSHGILQTRTCLDITHSQHLWLALFSEVQLCLHHLPISFRSTSYMVNHDKNKTSRVCLVRRRSSSRVKHCTF